MKDRICSGIDVEMVLTNLPVENLNDATDVLRFCIRRWECEEGIRFLKNQVNLEKIRTFRCSAIRRLVLLAVLVMTYLGWLVESHPGLCDRLVYLSHQYLLLTSQRCTEEKLTRKPLSLNMEDLNYRDQFGILLEKRLSPDASG